jgi:hypothetical protein
MKQPVVERQHAFDRSGIRVRKKLRPEAASPALEDGLG